MDPNRLPKIKVIKKASMSTDPVSEAMRAFKMSDNNKYSELFAATARRFAFTDGAAPSPQVNKSGFVTYKDNLAGEFRSIISQFMDVNGKVDITKVNEMIKKYDISPIRNDGDLIKSINAIQKTYDVSKKYYDKNLALPKNQLKFDARGNFSIMGTAAMKNQNSNFPKKIEEEVRQRFKRIR